MELLSLIGGSSKLSPRPPLPILSPEEHYQQGMKALNRAPSTAFNHVKLAAENNYSPAKLQLAKLYLFGTGVPQDNKQAFTWLEAATKILLETDEHYPETHLMLGNMYYRGMVSDITPEYQNHNAYKHFCNAALLKNPNALCAVGRMVLLGEVTGEKKDLNLAISYFEQAAEMGNAEAMYELGLINQAGNDSMPKNMENAIALFIQASNLGHSKATYTLGTIAADIKEAVEYYIKAASQNNQDAVVELVNIGQKLANSENLDNLKIALSCFNLAATLGNSDAMCRLGDFHFKGIAVKADIDAAARYYLNAATGKNKNSIPGLMKVAHAFSKKGEDEKAFKCFKSAADLGSAHAMFFVGIRYLGGKGIKESHSEGISYLRAASNEGLPNASYSLGVILSGPKSTEGRNLMIQAAKAGHGEASNDLGDYFRRQIPGTTKNYNTALEYYNLALVQKYLAAYVGLAKLHRDGGGVHPHPDCKPKPETALSYFNLALENEVIRMEGNKAIEVTTGNIFDTSKLAKFPALSKQIN